MSDSRLINDPTEIKHFIKLAHENIIDEPHAENKSLRFRMMLNVCDTIALVDRRLILHEGVNHLQALHVDDAKLFEPINHVPIWLHVVLWIAVPVHERVLIAHNRKVDCCLRRWTVMWLNNCVWHSTVEPQIANGFDGALANERGERWAVEEEMDSREVPESLC